MVGGGSNNYECAVSIQGRIGVRADSGQPHTSGQVPAPAPPDPALTTGTPGLYLCTGPKNDSSKGLSQCQPVAPTTLERILRHLHDFQPRQRGGTSTTDQCTAAAETPWSSKLSGPWSAFAPGQGRDDLAGELRLRKMHGKMHCLDHWRKSLHNNKHVSNHIPQWTCTIITVSSTRGLRDHTVFCTARTMGPVFASQNACQQHCPNLHTPPWTDAGTCVRS